MSNIPPKLLAAFLMTCGALCFSVSTALTKTLSPSLHTVVLVFLKSFFGFCFFVPFFYKKNPRFFYTKNLSLHIIRGGFVSLGVFLAYYTYRSLPLSLATSIGMTGPLFVACFSILFLREKVNKRKWALIVLGYVGVLIIVRPHQLVFSIGILTGISANISAASAVILAKKMTVIDKAPTVLFYSTLVTMCVSGMFSYGLWTYSPAFFEYGVIVLIGCFGFLSQFCMVKALEKATPSFLSPFEYTRLCFAWLIGFIVLKEVFSLWLLLGTFLVVGSTYQLTKSELRTP